MKKTLKILMAIILFAVVLTIATSVNAASLSDLEYKLDASSNPTGYFVKSVVDGVTVYTLKVNYSGEQIVVNEKATIELDGHTLANADATQAAIVVGTNGNVTIKNSNTTTANVTIAQITNNGTLNVEKGVTVTALVNTKTVTVDEGKVGTLTNNAGTVEVKGTPAAALVTALDNNGGTVNVENVASVTAITTDNGNVVVGGDAEAIITIDGAAAAEYSKVKTVGTDVETLVAKKADITAKFVNAVDTDGVVSTKLEAGKTYKALTFKVFYDERELDETATLDDTKLPFEVRKSGAEYEVAEDADGKTLTFKVTVLTAEKDVSVVVGENNEDPEEPGTTDPENPGTTTPTEPTTPGNDDEHDNSPETGDHIIPATAILAVVVVANVVYFARSKRS